MKGFKEKNLYLLLFSDLLLSVGSEVTGGPRIFSHPGAMRSSLRVGGGGWGEAG